MSARRLATLAWALSLVTAVPTLVLLAIGPGRVLPSDIFAGGGGGSFLILALTFASVGVIIARRVPENRIGWVFCLTGLVNSVQLLSWQYADVGLHRTDRLSGAAAAAVFNSMIGEATAGLLGLSLLLFPDGRLLSRRWRPALFSLLAGMALLALAGTLRPGRFAATIRGGVEPARGARCACGACARSTSRGGYSCWPGSASPLWRWSCVCAERAGSSGSGSSSCLRSALPRRAWLLP